MSLFSAVLQIALWQVTPAGFGAVSKGRITVCVHTYTAHIRHYAILELPLISYLCIC